MSASSHACSHARNPAPGWWEDLFYEMFFAGGTVQQHARRRFLFPFQDYIGPGRPLDTNLFFDASSDMRERKAQPSKE